MEQTPADREQVPAAEPPPAEAAARKPVPAPEGWDWSTERKDVADLTRIRAGAPLALDPVVSADGERIALLCGREDGSFGVEGAGEAWAESSFEKAHTLRFAPDGRLAVLVRIDDQWTVAVDGVPWEERFAFAWQLQFAASGAIAVQAKRELEHTVVIDGKPWEQGFLACRDFAISPDGKTAAALVQVEELGEAEIEKFMAGTWSVAVNGVAWPQRFVGVYTPTIAPDGRVAACVRASRFEYTVAENGELWSARFPAVWEPLFRPGSNRPLAPVRVDGAWTLAEGGDPVWSGRYVQLWMARASADGRHLAATVAPSFGRWTIAVDDRPWPIDFGEYVGEPFFSADGEHVAAIVKDAGRSTIAVDGRPWSQSFDTVWDPVFSPDGKTVLAKVRDADGYGLVANGRRWQRRVESVWDPVFSADGKRLLVRSVEGGHYLRQVLPLSALLG
jgi:hypothetical protein